jgi:hypothetical protein
MLQEYDQNSDHTGKGFIGFRVCMENTFSRNYTVIMRVKTKTSDVHRESNNKENCLQKQRARMHIRHVPTKKDTHNPCHVACSSNIVIVIAIIM